MSMKASRFEVLSKDEIERIHAASMEILSNVGVRVDYPRARDIFRNVDFVTQASKEFAQGDTDGGVVLDDQHSAHAGNSI